MEAIAVTNAKGGSGKTSTAVNLAEALGSIGKRVLVLDLDPQGSASLWLGQPIGSRALFDAIINNESLESLAVVTGNIRNVSIIPGSAFLMSYDKATAGEIGAETLLREALAKTDPSAWDVLLIDCPPTMSLLSLSALAAARFVLVPVEATPMALAGLTTLLQTIDRVRVRLNPGLSILGILPCRVDVRRKLSGDVVDLLRQSFGARVTKTVIRENVKISEAYGFNQPISLYDAKSTGAADYLALAKELVRRLKTLAPMGVET